MREVTTNIELDCEILIDIDVLTDDSYIAITDKGCVVFPFDRIEISQTFKFPIIRQLNDKSFLIADSRTNDEETDNCFIYDLKGNALKHFYAGDGIQDIEVLRDKIIVTYFDEGVYGADGPNNEGLVIFDFDGNILSKYNEKHGDQIISDCYCICKHGANRILFLPYTEFPLIELNLDTGDEKKYEIPENVKGSNALTSTADSIIFHSPYDDKRGIYKWRTGDKTAKRIGEYGEGLRGLKNGRFISCGQKGFTILDLN
ncbi:MAG TPA: hypothetical protein VIM65_16955 [Cyclobacteriaceae bacterium]